MSLDVARHERANRLAIEGGAPVRSRPLPWELPGAHWIGDEELFEQGYSYVRGALPKCDELHDRSALLAISSNLTDSDVADIILAFTEGGEGRTGIRGDS
jgi:hypothetical protein